MRTLLKYRRFNRKKAGLSHKKAWYIVDTLVIVLTISLTQFFINSIIYGI